MAEATPSVLDNTNERVQPIFKDGRYSNPWLESWKEKKFSERIKFLFAKSYAKVPHSEVRLCYEDNKSLVFNLLNIYT